MNRTASGVRIAKAESHEDIERVRNLLHEYLTWVFTLEPDSDKAPTFLGIEKELASLPGIYAPPSGRLLLAKHGDEAGGCVCLKAISPEVSEVKRLYVRPEMRGLKIGQQLVTRLVDEARQAGYRRIILDSHKSMRHAHAIYEAAGFRRVDPPEDFPEHLKSVAIFMECLLS